MSKRYDVLSPRKKKDGSTFWHRVGMAWEGDKGISIEFSSLPLPDAEGKVRVSLFEPREKSEDQTPPSGGRPRSMKDTLPDDEIPF